jgi:hypothetical protein
VLVRAMMEKGKAPVEKGLQMVKKGGRKPAGKTK